MMQEDHGQHAAALRNSSVTHSDVKLAIQSVGLFVAPFETLLRQADPATTLGQLTALDIIVHAGSMRPYRLGQLMMTSRQLAWQTCKRLEVLGLVTMTERVDGQTVVTVTPTDAGIAHLQAIAAIYERLAEEMSRLNQVIDISPAKAAFAALAHAAERLCQAKPVEGGTRHGAPVAAGAGGPT